MKNKISTLDEFYVTIRGFGYRFWEVREKYEKYLSDNKGLGIIHKGFYGAKEAKDWIEQQFKGDENKWGIHEDCGFPTELCVCDTYIKRVTILKCKACKSMSGFLHAPGTPISDLTQTCRLCGEVGSVDFVETFK